MSILEVERTKHFVVTVEIWKQKCWQWCLKVCEPFKVWTPPAGSDRAKLAQARYQGLHTEHQRQV